MEKTTLEYAKCSVVSMMDFIKEYEGLVRRNEELEQKCKPKRGQHMKIIHDAEILNIGDFCKITIRTDCEMKSRYTNNTSYLYVDEVRTAYLSSQMVAYPPTDEDFKLLDAFTQEEKRLRNELAEAVIANRPADLRSRRVVAEQN